MNKVIFLDIDGVLNSHASLMADIELEDSLILNLKEIVDKTGAKIILSSSWRCMLSTIRLIMDKFDKFGLFLSGMTQDGVDLEFIDRFEFFKPTRKYLDTRFDHAENRQIKITHDRGAEIFKWLCDHDDCNYIIIDDETADIEPYFKKDIIIKTSFETGLTKKEAEKAITILNN